MTSRNALGPIDAHASAAECLDEPYNVGHWYERLAGVETMGAKLVVFGAEGLVVDDEDERRRTVPGRSIDLLDVHHEAGVALEGADGASRIGKGSTDCRRHSLAGGHEVEHHLE